MAKEETTGGDDIDAFDEWADPELARFCTLQGDDGDKDDEADNGNDDDSCPPLATKGECC